MATIWHNPCFNMSVRVRSDGTAYGASRSRKRYRRGLQECFNSTKRGYTMPAFTFEKISPPENRGPIPPVANKKQRGVIVQILDRFVEARVKRTQREEEKGVIARNPHRPPD